MVNMVNTAVNNNIYAGRKSGSKYNQSKAFQQKEVLETPDVAAVNKYANVQEIYEALKYLHSFSCSHSDISHHIWFKSVLSLQVLALWYTILLTIPSS